MSSDLKKVTSEGGEAGIGDVEAAADVLGEIAEAATEGELVVRCSVACFAFIGVFAAAYYTVRCV